MGPLGLYSLAVNDISLFTYFSSIVGSINIYNLVTVQRAH
jgi:hypothetical protein